VTTTFRGLTPNGYVLSSLRDYVLVGNDKVDTQRNARVLTFPPQCSSRSCRERNEHAIESGAGHNAVESPRTEQCSILGKHRGSFPLSPASDFDVRPQPQDHGRVKTTDARLDGL